MQPDARHPDSTSPAPRVYPGRLTSAEPVYLTEPEHVAELLALPPIIAPEPAESGVPPSFRDVALHVWTEADAAGDPEWRSALPAERAAIIAGRVVHVAGAAESLARAGYTGPGALARYLADMGALAAPGETFRAQPPEALDPGGPLPIGKLLPDFLAASAEGVAWAVAGLIPEAALVAVLGRPESFKTMGLIHLGLALAGGPDWLGFPLGDRRPFIYASNEKTAGTVRERFRRMTADAPPSEPVVVMHRTGLTFGDPKRWGELVAVAAMYADAGRPPFVALDTLASLAGAGFNENDGRDMATVLAAVRRLTDLGATVALAHHPAKHGEGTGGIRMRGHSSLHGEVDGSLEFTRPDRAAESGMIRGEPKDADLALVRFAWSRETFRLEAEAGRMFLTARTVADVVALLAEREPVTADAIHAKFPAHGRSAFMDRLSEAVALGLVTKTGGSKATRYSAGRIPDEWSDGGSESWT